ncbi:hypothetical protein PS687_03386 [Pseudomonas fluorescens]|nr:hypothetical protein PS664_03998 [Pseudomonas fluorescens]VVN59503.1 hypothetical protein PS687_03386 [Pseudomonas fluorescens]
MVLGLLRSPARGKPAHHIEQAHYAQSKIIEMTNQLFPEVAYGTTRPTLSPQPD